MVIRSRRPGPFRSLVASAAVAGVAATALLAGGAGGVGGTGRSSDGPGAAPRPVALDAPGLVIRSDALPDGTAAAVTGRHLLTFAQLSDIHLIDEGSPLRTEFLDPWMGTAYRPQEGLTTQVLARMTQAVRAARSPASGWSPELVFTTGDNTDTGQANEVRWFIDTLDGGTIDPDSGVPGSCGTDPTGPRSVSWPGAGRGYDPEPPALLAVQGSVAMAVAGDGPGYAAVAARNQATVGRASALPDHPGLLAAMNQPFVAPGLGLPWYASFGNHDALVQGNAPVDPDLERLAGGCTKVLALPPAVLGDVDAAAAAGGRDGMLHLAFGAMTAIAERSDPAALTARIAADPMRVPLSKRAFIAEHFRTTGTPVGHGFAEDGIRTGDGYYAVAPTTGVRLLGLETVNEAGGHQGNLDAAQFAWLHAQLLAADRAGDLVVAFGHHTLASMVQAAPGAHLGGFADGRAEPCATTRPEDPVTDDESVRCLFLRHPSLVAYVDGHEHRNHITSHLRPVGAGIPGGFWEITTASHIEWPQEARLLELVDAGDQLAIVTSMIDHSPATDVAADAPLDSIATLAAIGRQLSYGDPQGRNGRDGTSDPSGSAGDRETVLLLPYPPRGG